MIYRSFSIFLVRAIYALFLKPLVGLRFYEPVFLKLYAQAINGLNYNRHGGVQDSGEGQLLKQLSRIDGLRMKTFIDAGAHHGEYTDLIIQYFDEPEIWLLEPSPSCLKVLNQKYNGNDNVTVVPKGLGTKSGELFIQNEGSKIATLSSSPTGAGEQIPVTDLLDLSRSQHIAEIDLLKLDIEGMEFSVLQSNIEAIRSLNVKVIQFEFGSGVLRIAEKHHLVEIVSLLSPFFQVGRIMSDGVVPLSQHISMVELYHGANYLAVNKNLPEIWEQLT